MKNKIIILTLLISSIFSQVDKRSIVYDQSYVKETFEMRYSEDWNFRWNMHGTPHRVYGKNIPYSFNIDNENLAEYYARKFIEDNEFLFFVAKGDGYHIFSKTEKEHFRAKKQFQKLRKRKALKSNMK